MAIVLNACLIALLTACTPGDVDRPDVGIDPAARITAFSMGWGDFHTGFNHFQIEYYDGQYLFTALRDSWESFDERSYAPHEHPIPVDEVKKLRQLIEDYNIAKWNGYRSYFTDENTSDFSFGITIVFDDDNRIDAVGANDFDNRPTPDFDEQFNALTTHLRQMADRLAVEPEWGELMAVSYYLRFPRDDSMTIRFSLTQQPEGSVEFIASYQMNECRNLYPYYNLNIEINETLDANVLEEFHELMLRYEIDQWWHPESPAQQSDFEWRFELDIQYDNSTGFTARANRDLMETAGHKAMASFFEDLSGMPYENLLLVHEVGRFSCRRLEDGIFNLRPNLQNDENAPFAIMRAGVAAGRVDVGAEIVLYDGDWNVIYRGKIVHMESAHIAVENREAVEYATFGDTVYIGVQDVYVAEELRRDNPRVMDVRNGRGTF